MAVSHDFLDHVTDLLDAVGPVQSRKMFSGAGLFVDGTMFALIADDVLYLKADAANQAAFEAEGLAPFTYRGKSREVSLGYRRAPERVLDDREEMVAWARLAITAARRAAAAKASKPAKAAGSKRASKGKPRSCRHLRLEVPAVFTAPSWTSQAESIALLITVSNAGKRPMRNFKL